MSDDDINQMLERLSDGGIPETQIRHVLELLGFAEALKTELGTRLAPSQDRDAQEEVAGAMLKVFRQ